MGSTVARNLQMMARMGIYFEEQVARRYPEFPVRTRSARLGGVSSAAQSLAE